MGANEYFIGGMEFDEVLTTRATMALTTLFINRPYGKFRDIWAKKVMKADGYSSKLKKFTTDVTASAVFYAPVYTAMIKASGASWEETGSALAGGMALITLTGRSFGGVLDKSRELFGIKPALNKGS